MNRPRWEGWGFLLGPSLPSSRLDFGASAKVVPVDDGHAEQLGRDVALAPPPTIQPHASNQNFARSMMGYRGIRSNHVLVLRSSEQDRGSAQREMIARLAPSVLAALSIVGGSPVRFELCLVAELHPDGRLTDALSPWADATHIRIDDPDQLMGRRRREAKSLAIALMTDDLGRELAARYDEAVAQQDLTTTERPLRSAGVLLSFFLIVEQVTDRVTRSEDGGSSGDVDMQPIIDGLAEQLARPDMEESWYLRQIRRTAQQIADAQGSHLSARIRRTGDVLGLSQEVVDSAEQLRRARNKKITHPGEMPGRELLQLLREAEPCARAFLEGYSRRLGRWRDP